MKEVIKLGNVAKSNPTIRKGPGKVKINSYLYLKAGGQPGEINN